MTSKLTKEWLQHQISAIQAVGITDSNTLAAFKLALAALDSEPVACGNGCSKSKWHKMALDIDEYMNGEDARESKGRDEIYSEIILRLTRLDVLETILRNEIGLPYGSPIPDIAEKIYDIKRARIYSVVPDDLSIFEAAIEECKKCDSIDEHAWNHGVLAVIAEYESCRAAMLHAGNSPAQAECTTGFESYMERAGRSDATSVIAISLVSIARRTAGLLRQLDFKPNEESENPIEVLLFDAEKVESEIKEMKKNRAAMLAAAPHDTHALNSVQSVDSVADRWIPVSERMPEIGDIVLTAMGGVVNVGEMECSAANCRFFTSVISGRELPATHWMPMPTAPQEVK
ncbi:DUF551 domain-containing protein [Klebsiella quasipneumoniae]